MTFGSRSKRCDHCSEDIILKFSLNFPSTFWEIGHPQTACTGSMLYICCHMILIFILPIIKVWTSDHKMIYIHSIWQNIRWQEKLKENNIKEGLTTITCLHIFLWNCLNDTSFFTWIQFQNTRCNKQICLLQCQNLLNINIKCTLMCQIQMTDIVIYTCLVNYFVNVYYVTLTMNEFIENLFI